MVRTFFGLSQNEKWSEGPDSNWRHRTGNPGYLPLYDLRMAPARGIQPLCWASKTRVLALNDTGKTYGVVITPITGGSGVNKTVTLPAFDGPLNTDEDPVGTASTSYEYWVPPVTVESL